MEEKTTKTPKEMRFEFLSGENGVLFQEKRVDEKS